MLSLHHSIFMGHMLFVTPNQQYHSSEVNSTEGKKLRGNWKKGSGIPQIVVSCIQLAGHGITSLTMYIMFD